MGKVQFANKKLKIKKDLKKTRLYLYLSTKISQSQLKESQTRMSFTLECILNSGFFTVGNF